MILEGKLCASQGNQETAVIVTFALNSLGLQQLNAVMGSQQIAYEPILDWVPRHGAVPAI